MSLGMTAAAPRTCKPAGIVPTACVRACPETEPCAGDVLAISLSSPIL